MATATRRSTTRSSAAPTGPSGARYTPASAISVLDSPYGATVMSASSAGNSPPPVPAACHRSGSTADPLCVAMAPNCTSTSRDTAGTGPTRASPRSSSPNASRDALASHPPWARPINLTRAVSKPTSATVSALTNILPVNPASRPATRDQRPGPGASLVPGGQPKLVAPPSRISGCALT